jgi:hypothetical protein
MRSPLASRIEPRGRANAGSKSRRTSGVPPGEGPAVDGAASSARAVFPPRIRARDSVVRTIRAIMSKPPGDPAVCPDRRSNDRSRPMAARRSRRRFAIRVPRWREAIPLDSERRMSNISAGRRKFRRRIHRRALTVGHGRQRRRLRRVARRGEDDFNVESLPPR